MSQRGWKEIGSGSGSGRGGGGGGERKAWNQKLNKLSIDNILYKTIWFSTIIIE